VLAPGEWKTLIRSIIGSCRTDDMSSNQLLALGFGQGFTSVVKELW
jgi:hypothetical protein